VRGGGLLNNPGDLEHDVVRERDAERLGGIHVHDELKRHRLLHRQIGGLDT
jgi:hypothetical protein